MYVCICQGVKEKQIRGEVRRGAATFEEIQLALDVGICCGKCQDTAEAVINETLQEQHALERFMNPLFQEA